MPHSENLTPFTMDLEAWASREPERLLIELRDLRRAKETAGEKLEKIERRVQRVTKRLREIRPK